MTLILQSLIKRVTFENSQPEGTTSIDFGKEIER